MNTSNFRCSFCGQTKVPGAWESVQDGQLLYRICPSCTTKPNYPYWKKNLAKREAKPEVKKGIRVKPFSVEKPTVEDKPIHRRLKQEIG